jgi:hypothetical protein
MKTTTIVVLALSGTCAACLNQQEAAVSHFVSDFSCPEARVTSTERTDLLPHRLLHGAAEPDPPSYLDGDLERTWMWRRRQTKMEEAEDDDYSVYEVKGCNLTEFILCKTIRKRSGAFVDCTTR